MMPGAPPRVLTIAGSDSGGGAGIEADLKTMTALGVYGMAAITSVTAQNTCAVSSIHDLPAEEVGRQIDAVLEDIGTDAAKTGMLSNAAIVETVADSLRRHGVERLVVDPVMAAKSGDVLLQTCARETLTLLLLPLTYVVTPNIPEAEILAGIAITDDPSLREAAARILAYGPRYVLIKGGHLPGGDATDHLFDGHDVRTFTTPRIDTKNTHGTGCTYSAAIAALLAQNKSIENAIEDAKTYLTGAIRHAFPLGRGHGPLNHMWQQH